LCRLTLAASVARLNILKKYLKFILLFLFAILILWFFGRNLDWAEVSGSLRRANPLYLTLATLGICLGYFLRAMRWRTLLAPITPASLKELFAATTVGFSVILIVGRMGEIVRSMWLPMRDPRVRPSAALVTLGVERICDLAALICFFAVNLLWFKPPAGRESELAYVKLIGVLMLAGTAAGFVVLFIYTKYSDRIIGRISGMKVVQNKIGRIFLSLLRQLAAALQILRNWKQVVEVTLWTLALWFAIALPTWLVIIAFDPNVSFSDSLFVMGWAAVGSVVPTPGGAAGAFHAATAGGLIFLGMDRDQAAAVSIAMHLVYFAPAVIFGIYYFIHGDVSVARLRSLLSSEHAVEEIQDESRVESRESRVRNRDSTAAKSPK
jgi:glycosyltransferase 2 family protein